MTLGPLNIIVLLRQRLLNVLPDIYATSCSRTIRLSSSSPQRRARLFLASELFPGENRQQADYPVQRTSPSVTCPEIERTSFSICFGSLTTAFVPYSMKQTFGNTMIHCGQILPQECSFLIERHPHWRISSWQSACNTAQALWPKPPITQST